VSPKTCLRPRAEALARLGGLGGKTLVAGVVDGRNVWRTDLPGALSTCASLLGLVDQLIVSTSCSLLHVPLELGAETSLPPELTGRLAFARQKVDEVVTLGRALSGERDAVAPELASAPAPQVNSRVRARLDALGSGSPRGAYAVRRAAQADGLPLLPTTTIGSFPQTQAIRKARADHKAGRITGAAYTAAMRVEIDRVIALQEDIGLDVLVHGEPERNDMVQYFAERLDHLHPVPDQPAGQGHAHRPGHDAGLVIRPRRPAAGRHGPAGRARAAR
jgi:5-methyltetrahydropteroyltriglutamate--homocysteine methyltransferase